MKGNTFFLYKIIPLLIITYIHYSLIVFNVFILYSLT